MSHSGQWAGAVGFDQHWARSQFVGKPGGKCWACPADLDGEYRALPLSRWSAFTLRKVLPGPPLSVCVWHVPTAWAACEGKVLSTAAPRTAEVLSSKG